MVITTLKLTHPFPSPRAIFAPTISHAPKKPFFVRASGAESPEETKPEPEPEPGSDSFDARLSQLRLRYRSGTGKKAEIRKSKKVGLPRPGSGSIYLPPIPLKEAVSDGLKVDFGFCPYSERINGRIAILGLTALVLVELATGKSVINYHSPSVILIQVYFVAAASALYVKFEKEKVGVWPQD